MPITVTDISPQFRHLLALFQKHGVNVPIQTQVAFCLCRLSAFSDLVPFPRPSDVKTEGAPAAWFVWTCGALGSGWLRHLRESLAIL